MEPMIKLENIHQEFDGETILDNINLNIYEGEIVTIIGPSGAGKSTLLRFINLLNRPTSGKIYYLGEDIIQNRKILMCQTASRLFFKENSYIIRTVCL